MAYYDVGTYPLTTDEVLDPGVDLRNWLEPTDSIASATAVLFDKSLGVTVGGFLPGVPSISGTQVVQFVKNPLSGKTYALRLRVVTTQGRTYTPQVTIPTAPF